MTGPIHPLNARFAVAATRTLGSACAAPRLVYPATPKTDQVDSYFGTTVADW